MVGAALCSLGGDLVLQLVALRILGGICSYKLRLPFGPLALELVITAGIKRGLAVIEVKDVIDDIVQQVALMAHHHHRRPIGAEEGFQPQRRFQVEVVGRLRSEEHTSELQSLMRISYAVFCLKKKKKQHNHKAINI